ncbi:S8 family serine peptidase [Geodermatophilus sp. SYSU D00705]
MRRITVGAVVGAAAVTLAVPSVAAAAPAEARYLVVLADGVADPVRAATDLDQQYGGETESVYDAVNGYAAEMTQAEAAALEGDPAVAYVVSDGTFAQLDSEPFAVSCQQGPSPASAQCLPEDVDRIDGEQSSTASGDGAGAVGTNIAVIDTGVDRSHPDLNVVGGVDCSTGTPVDAPSAFTDAIGHGTFVAGVAAARDDGAGVVGVAPGAPVYSVKIFNDTTGTATNAAVLCAADWVTQTRLDDDPANDIAVANMSIGGAGTDDGQCGATDQDAMHTAICRSVEAGTLYVAAAGNSTVDFGAIAPATYDEVLTVTAASDFDGRPGGQASPTCYGTDFGQLGDRDDAAASYSNYATTEQDRSHTVAAPGTCVTGPMPGSAYGAAAGTSFSAPLVSGTAALCIDAGICSAGDPVATADRIRADATDHNTADRAYGFEGDPVRMAGERYYGFLVRAAAY